VATQRPFAHVVPDGQCVLQSPQNCGSALGSTQPFPPFAVEHASGVAALHVTSHVPPEHAGVPVAAPERGPPHAVVQLPQWLTSVCRSKQEPAHFS
jgi:hypothetical protein